MFTHRHLPGNSLSADERIASIAQVREACPRDIALNLSTNRNLENLHKIKSENLLFYLKNMYSQIRRNRLSLISKKMFL